MQTLVKRLASLIKGTAKAATTDVCLRLLHPTKAQKGVLTPILIT